MRTRQGVAFVRKFHYFGLSRHTHTPLGYLCARYSYICTHAIYSQGLKVKSFCLSAKINFHLTCNGPQKTCFPSGLGQVMWPRPPIFFSPSSWVELFGRRWHIFTLRKKNYIGIYENSSGANKAS